jgi:hypothetical protein
MAGNDKLRGHVTDMTKTAVPITLVIAVAMGLLKLEWCNPPWVSHKDAQASHGVLADDHKVIRAEAVVEKEKAAKMFESKEHAKETTDRQDREMRDLVRRLDRTINRAIDQMRHE